MRTHVIDWSYYKGTVPGYGDTRAVPGEYACLFPDRYVESSFSGQTGRSALPGENINYLRIPRNPGDGRMAGGGQSTDLALEWDVTHWTPRGTMFGPNGLIYGASDTLVTITSRAEYQATMGWRYVNTGTGRLVDCESTYADKSRGIYEWTDFGDVAIGQGADGIAVVSFPGEPLRRLDPRPIGDRDKPADMRFMRPHRAGDLFGIAIPELKGRKTYFVWPTLSELRALPFVTEAPVPPVPVPPTPVPPPTPPNPEPPAMDYLAIVTDVRKKYGRLETDDDGNEHWAPPLGDNHWKFLVEVAQRAGVQLYSKPGGAHVEIPPLSTATNKVYVSLDVVGRGSMGNHWADILSDAEGEARPSWRVGDGPAGGTYIDVSGIVLPGQPAPGPGPQPPSGQCEARVAELEGALRQIRDIAAGVL